MHFVVSHRPSLPQTHGVGDDTRQPCSSWTGWTFPTYHRVSMTSSSRPSTGVSLPPKRRLRNYLLEPRFQLKYTGQVVLVTALIAGSLGWFAYDFSTGVTQSIAMCEMLEEGASMDRIMADASQKDRSVLLMIIGGIGLLVLALGITGVFVTHRLVGPAYKLRRLINHVANGHLEVAGRLRKGDELQDIFLAFERMILELRRRQQVEIDQIDEVLATFSAADASSVPRAKLQEVRDAMGKELERKTLM